MRKFLISVLSCLVFAIMQATAATVTVTNYESVMPYKNATLYVFSASTYSVGVSSSVGVITNCSIDHQSMSAGQSTIGIPLSGYADNDIHCVNVNLANGDAEGFYFTTISEFGETESLIFGLDSQNMTAKVIGVKGNPAYVNVPATVTIGDFTYKINELASYSFFDVPNLSHIRTGESVETVRDIIKTGLREEIPDIYDDQYITLICDKAVKKIKTSDSFVDRLIFLGDNPPEVQTHYAVPLSFVPNTNYNFSNQIIYPNLPNMFESEGIVYVPTDMSARTCDILDWNESALGITSFEVDGIVNYRGIEFIVENVAKGGLSSHPDFTKVIMKNHGDIGDNAFINCRKLATADLRNNGNVGSYAFYSCVSLTKASFYNNGSLGCVFQYNAPVEELIVKNSGDVANEGFKYCRSLKKAVVEIGGRLGDNAFEDCSELTDVTLGDIGSLGTSIFYNCKSLKKVGFTGTLPGLPAWMFKGCASLLSIDLPDGLITIDDAVFSGCSALTQISIPGSVRTLGHEVFDGCSSLTDLTFKKTVYPVDYEDENAVVKSYYSMANDLIDINKEAEFELKSGETLSFGIFVNEKVIAYDNKSPDITVTVNGTKIINKTVYSKPYYYQYKHKAKRDETIKVELRVRNNTYSGSGIKNIWIYPENLPYGGLAISSDIKSNPVKHLIIDRQLNYTTPGISLISPQSPFKDNTSIESVHIGDDVKELDVEMFKGCISLTDCYVGNGIKNIPSRTFSGCESLKSFTLGNKIESLGYEAFAGCTGIEDFYSYSLIPPVCETDALTNINKWECTLHVQPESLEAYKQADQWKEFFFINTDISEVDIVAEDFESTAIGNFAKGIYTIDGISVSPEYDEITFSNLSSGLYIVNGKKVVKK